MAFPKRLHNYIITRQRNGHTCYEQSLRFLNLAEWHEKYTSGDGGSYQYTATNALSAAAHFQRLSAMHYKHARRMQGIGKRVVTIQFVVMPAEATAEDVK